MQEIVVEGANMMYFKAMFTCVFVNGKTGSYLVVFCSF